MQNRGGVVLLVKCQGKFYTYLLWVWTLVSHSNEEQPLWCLETNYEREYLDLSLHLYVPSHVPVKSWEELCRMNFRVHVQRWAEAKILSTPGNFQVRGKEHVNGY